MELIPGYDDWKTSPPEDPDPIAYCARCEAPLWEGDVIDTVEGPMCEECLGCCEDSI